MLKAKMKISMLLLLTGLLVVNLLAMGDPLEEPRMGAWIDEVIVIVADRAVVVSMIEAGIVHAFAATMACPDSFRRVVESPYMEYGELFGALRPLFFSQAGTPEEPVFADGRLNPFAIRRIREAMHWLIDRDYIAEVIWGGLAIPRYVPISPAFPDYTRLIETTRRLELYYAHNPAKAEAIITEEMKKLGAVLIDGIWHWDGKPVEIISLMWHEGPRLHKGLYISRLLEDLGFETKNLIKTAPDHSILIRKDPYEGHFHIWGAGWIFGTILRDSRGVIQWLHNPRGWGIPLWQAKKPSAEFDELTERLDRGDFETLEERAELFGRVLELAMKDAGVIHVVNPIGFNPRRAEIELAADLAGGIGGSRLWPHTLRFVDQVGGSATIAMPSLMVRPWNPVAGSGWIVDLMFKRAMLGRATMPDPFTGLHHPQRVERAEVYVREGLPVGVTLDWIDLQFVSEAMEVPADAWVDWDATEQRFITLAEAREKEEWDPARATADIRVRIHYPADLFDTVKWHDGSPLTLADFVMGMILTFDRPNPDSPIHDPATIRGFSSFMGHFRGMRIVSEEPLIIETFTNRFSLDAELIASAWTHFPGDLAWHNLVPGILAERNKELAFGSTKAAYLDVEWTNFISGPSLPILERHLADAKARTFIPYYPTLGRFITPEEAVARYANQLKWVEERGHFWIGLGPFYLVEAHPIEKVLHLRRNPYFPDRADRWAGFAVPKIAEVDVIGPPTVIAGDEAAFDIEVTFEGEPYPVADIDVVTYLLVDATGEVVYVGRAVAIEYGLWQVVIPAEKTAALALGTTTLEVVVVSMLVAIPTFDAATFVLLP